MSVLEKIVSQRKQRITQLYQMYPLKALRLKVNNICQQRPTRSLYDALGHPDKGFILECKKASPSKGMIRANFNPVEIATTYQPYAAAISVLTEPDYFQGDFAYLQAVSQQVRIPVLCKDFIIDPIQVWLARYFGADAILLMLSVLDDHSYLELTQLADSLDLDVVTEVSNEAEMHRAVQLNNQQPVNIIGINHRNLHDLTIDPQRSQMLSSFAPAQSRLIAESGFTDHQQIRVTAPYVDGFLVGSHLTAQSDIDRACRRLIYGENKVCGLTRCADALLAAACGAVYGGLIFADHSPRQISKAQAATLIQEVPQLEYVAVVTEPDADKILRQIDTLALSAIQLHGNQSEHCVTEIARQRPELDIWYAVDMAGNSYQNTLNTIGDWPVKRLVLDHGPGGSGQSFDWTRLTALTPEQRKNALLAGGIGPSNADRAASLIACSDIAGVDINSAVEIAPGCKDAALVQQTFMTLSRYFKAPYSKDTHHDLI